MADRRVLGTERFPERLKVIPKRPLGRTGMKTSEIGLGCWGIGGPMRRDGTVSGYGPVNDEESVGMLRHAFEQGVNFVDTAPWYGNGHSERLVGEVIKFCRQSVIISTKIGVFLRDQRYTTDYSGDYILAHYQDSLERLGTDYIDIFLLHSPTRDLYRRDGLKALRELKRRNVVRAFGISFPASHEECETFFLPLCEEERIEVVQLSFNLLHWMARARIIPKLAAMGIGVISREPLYFGYLTGRFTKETVFDSSSDVRSTWSRERHLSLVGSAERLSFLHRQLACSPVQAALGYCLSQPGVSCVIPGAMTIPELDENLSAARVRVEGKLLNKIHEIQEEEFGTKF